MTTTALGPLGGSVVALDAQAFSLLGEADFHSGKRRMMTALKIFNERGYDTAVSVVTLAEQRRTGEAGQRLAWWRSQIDRRIPVSEEIAEEAAQLREGSSLDGHENVIDALVVATAAIITTDRAVILSSDETHIPKLCAEATRRGRRPVEFRKI